MLKAKALQYLAQRDHSRQELRGKLLRWQRRAAQQHDGAAAHPVDAGEALEASDDEAAAAVDAVLDELAAAGWISDERFAESRVHARLGRFGNRRIESELRQHGVQASAETLEQMRASEVQRASALLCTRLRTPAAVAPPGPAQRLRWQRFLAGRGFSREAIAVAIRKLVRDPATDD